MASAPGPANLVESWDTTAGVPADADLRALLERALHRTDQTPE